MKEDSKYKDCPVWFIRYNKECCLFTKYEAYVEGLPIGMHHRVDYDYKECKGAKCLLIKK